MTGWEKAGGRVLGGPWRLTEPCDVTVGGATWLDQAQETAARKTRVQVHTGGGRWEGQQESCANQSKGGRGEGSGFPGYRRGEAIDSCSSA